MIGKINGGIPLLTNLKPHQTAFWNTANRLVLWGWKRDVGPENRLVYFSGNLELEGGNLALRRFYFAYRAMVLRGTGSGLIADFERAAEAFARLEAPSQLLHSRRDGREVIAFTAGDPSAADVDKVTRLKLRRPRRRIQLPDFPAPVRARPDESLFPADLYVGSGLSYEAGLPTLCDMHDAFAVDCHKTNGFMTGARDWLPRALADDLVGRLRLFCKVHSQAMVAEPTAAMHAIAELANAGRVRKIFTDNVDNLLSKVDVPFERVRGSGVFNERYEARFASPSLLVIGVAADRRQIIKQARQRSMRIVVVNPCKKVSPNVTHLDYLTRRDVFYKTDARTFFGRLAECSKRSKS